MEQVTLLGAIGLFGALYCGVLIRHRRRLAACGLGLATIVANSLIAWLCIYAMSIGGILMMILLALGLLPVALGCGGAWMSSATWDEANGRRLPWLAWSLATVACLTPLTMIANLWPLQLAFGLSRPSLDALADRVARGQTVTGPERAGLYEVVKSSYDPRSGDVALFVDDDNPSGFLRLGFRDPFHSSHLFINLNVDVRMDDRWRYQNED